ncbi:MAG: hypothetical protein OXG78_07300 [Chloroflexi bacterium]|nr:hypothetical protein [Chloroflexota bacterium]
MKSSAPRDYESLPGLEPPAGYVCVIRDIDSDNYRIEGAAHPGLYIEALLNEEKRDFGIELLSILETEDLATAEAELYELYHARLSSDWLDLDPYQLEVLRRSVLQIDAYPSHYLTPQRAPYAREATRPKPISRYRRLASSYHRGTSEAEGFRRAYSRPSTGPNRSQWKHRRPRQPIPERRYGARSLRRNRDMSRHHGEKRLSIRAKAGELFEDLFVNHPGIVIAVLLTLMLILLLHFGPMSRYYW